MFAPIPKPPISHRRKVLALSIAGAADMLQIFILPLIIEGGASPIEDFIDILTALLLTAVCGFKWQFVFAFFMELVPGLDILPTWSAVALLIPSAPNDMQATRLYPEQNALQNPSLHPPIEVSATPVPSIPAGSMQRQPPPPAPPNVL